MRKKILLLVLCVVAWSVASAVPAKRGIRVFTQSDGTQVHLELTGDEWNSSYITAEGLTVSRADDGNFYYKREFGIRKPQSAGTIPLDDGAYDIGRSE